VGDEDGAKHLRYSGRRSLRARRQADSGERGWTHDSRDFGRLRANSLERVLPEVRWAVFTPTAAPACSEGQILVLLDRSVPKRWVEAPTGRRELAMKRKRMSSVSPHRDSVVQERPPNGVFLLIRGRF